MSSALQRASSTVSSHTSDRSAGRSHHPRLDGATVGETGADQSSLVNSTTGMHTVSMSPDTLSSPEVGRVSFTEPFHISDQSATDHSYHRVEDASHRTDTYNTSIIGETGAGKSPWLHWFVRTQMAASSLSAMSSSGRPSSPSAASRSFHRVEDTPHRTDTCNVVIVGETGAGKSSSTADTQTPPLSPGTMTSSPDAGRPSPTELFHTSIQSATGHRSDRVEDASHRADTCYATTVEETGASQRSWVHLITATQPALSSRSAMPPPPDRALSTVCGVWRFLTVMLTRSQSNISDQSIACPSYQRVEEALGRTDASKAVRPTVVGETGAGKIYWLDWLIKKQMALNSLDATSSSGRISSTVHTTGQGAAYPNHHRIEEASRRTDTCNVVIFGETGSGKSSLVNLVTGKEIAPTSPDATGCTTEPTVYEHDVTTQNKTVKVQLFDTAGLDEGSEEMIPTMQGQRALKTLLRTLKKNRDIHLLIYCVRGTKDARALQRNYKLLHSKVKGRVPIVLVVTALEDREPEMEDWWRNNETLILDLGMKFAGHACITAVTIDQDDTDKLRQRREQSYNAVCSLFEHCRLQDRSGAHRVIPIPPARKTKNIVLFGEAGAGKSSVVNLMAGRDVAHTSPGMRRCTLQWQDYTIDFDGESYKVFDTIGIEESGLEMEEYLVAVANAYRFIKTLDAEGGVDLLLFCIRAGRFTAALQSNYRFFHEFLCEKKVPIVLAITNLEREQRMEDWWDREHSIFPRHEIHVAGHACITAANGLDDRHQELYEESRIAIRTLVKENITGNPNEVWTGGNNAFVSLVRALKKLLVKNTHIRKMNLTGQLTKRCGMPRETAGQLVDMIEQGEVKVDSDTA